MAVVMHRTIGRDSLKTSGVGHRRETNAVCFVFVLYHLNYEEILKSETLVALFACL